ncbi:MAG: Ig-like domain-containing protein [Candidatus Omnitrophica bacterium]|nr:Ig-like domain-containing protein [Candidatus Omnitrophota bacterium]
MQNKYIMLFLSLILVACGSSVCAAPIINNVSGEFSDEAIVTIGGSSFGTKTTAAPQVFDDFEDGIDISEWSNPYQLTTVSDGQRGGVAQGDMGTNWARALDNKNSMPPTYGGKFYAAVWYKCTGNWNWSDAGWGNGYKWMRFHGGDIGAEFCWSEVSGSAYLTPNNANPAYSMIDGWTPRDMSLHQWHLFEFIIRVPSSNIATDGYARWYVDGELKSGCNLDPSDNLQWLGGSTSLGSWRFYRFGWHSNYGDITDGSLLQMDDAYIDSSWSRVVIGNNMSYNACTHRELQIPTSWNASSISVEVNTGTFQSGNQVYLFVIDNNGDPSVGFPVTIGQSGGDDFSSPYISSHIPTANSTNVSANTPISFHVLDAGEGVDQSSIRLYVNDQLVNPTISGSQNDYLVTFTPAQPFSYGQNVDIKVNAQDLHDPANVMPQVNYQFTIESAPANAIFAPGTAGNAVNYSPKTGSRWETVDEGGNIVYSINTTDFNQDGDMLGEYTLFNSQSFDTFDIELDARSDEDLVANGYADYAVVFGYTDASNYYYAIFNANAASNQLFRIVNGTRTELTSYTAAALVTDNAFHPVRVIYQGSTVSVYFDTNLVMQATGVTLPQGRVGFGSYNDAASFDDVVITDLGALLVEDVDKDGDIDADDVTIVKDQVIERTPATADGDVDSSGTVDSIDLQKVVNAVE